MTSQRSRAPGWALLPLLILGASLNTQAQTVDADEFAYIARPGDTLIGLGKRLLRDPQRWPEVQQRNHIGNEYRIKPGSTIRIPYSWLKVSAETASVTKVAGAVTRGGQPVAAGQSLDQGSQVETGPDGSVAIDLADGSQIVLHKSSSLRLSEMQRVDGVPNAHDIQVQLPAGHAETHVKPHRDVGRFEIVTPTAALAVRGTIFRASSSDAGTVTTETLEGVVAVSASGQTVSTEADFGTRVDKGAPPLKPMPLLPAPELSAVPGTNVRPQVHLEFPAIAGAKSYHLQVSDDPQFQTLVADVRSDQPSFDLPSPADGAYWVRARGIDSLDLEGHDAVQPFSQQLAPEPPKPPPPTPQLVKVTRHDLHFEWSADPSQQYRVQIARDPHFRRILTDQTLSDGNLVWHRPWPGRYYIRVAALPATAPPPPTNSPAASANVTTAPANSPPASANVTTAPATGATASANVTTAPATGATASTSGTPPATNGATMPAEGTAFDVPVPLWMRIAVPIVVLTPLLL
jgi:hypothetical protein